MPDAITDPISQIYDIIYAALTDFAPWAAIVKPNNRINFNESSPNKMLDAMHYADFPSVALTIGKSSFNIQYGQANTKMTQDYILILRSGASQLMDQHSLLIWQTFRALSLLPVNLGISFVWKMDVEAAETLDGISAELGGSVGYMTPVTISVDFQFLRSELST